MPGEQVHHLDLLAGLQRGVGPVGRGRVEVHRRQVGEGREAHGRRVDTHDDGRLFDPFGGGVGGGVVDVDRKRLGLCDVAQGDRPLARPVAVLVNVGVELVAGLDGERRRRNRCRLVGDQLVPGRVLRLGRRGLRGVPDDVLLGSRLDEGVVCLVALGVDAAAADPDPGGGELRLEGPVRAGRGNDPVAGDGVEGGAPLDLPLVVPGPVVRLVGVDGDDGLSRLGNKGKQPPNEAGLVCLGESL